MSQGTRPGGDLRSPILWLYLLLPILFCGWVMSMPVFPSTDGPLHLYLAEIFRQLLTHTPGLYSDTYFIKHYLPPYSVYYYGLAALGSIFGMEMADKLIVCCYFILFALGVRALCRAVSGSAKWAPFLVLPVLLNWPLMMGFVNYSVGTALACFALAVWCRNVGEPGVGRRVWFLALLVLVILTHPVPWMFAVGFALFDLGLRLLRYGLAENKTRAQATLRFFGLDLRAALIGCLGFPYLLYFKNKPVPTELQDHPEVHATYGQAVIYRLHEYGKTHGITAFGSHGALPYRLALMLLFVSALLLGVWHSRRVLRSGRWTLTETWTSFGLVFLVALPFIPPELNGSMFFAERLALLLYLTMVIAASGGMRDGRTLAKVFAFGAAAASVFSLWLAVRYISPEARDIATLWTAPVVSTREPGVMIRLKDASFPEALNYDPLAWAGANYFRRNDLLLFNTSWMNLSIIPVQPKPDQVGRLDGRFITRTPEPGMALLKTPEEAKGTLSKVAFALALPPENAPSDQTPFAWTAGSATQPEYADGWSCVRHQTWDLCRPNAR